ncbi:PHB depolymerase family esterase [Paracoccus sp. MBLB3053]|uniref:PHB depolymerase family esterase n=1 Tax=Paracoccus aurantius TaxID=3073814 RepID=A0ABU2HXV3_9RHOB|nr:PHB depolymerase family esterase [Paracoccus sp. MBLB3053]MDS9469883.1 PHB depolymerase family esterase [Paracoccus sp. MBLB3053]
MTTRRTFMIGLGAAGTVASLSLPAMASAPAPQAATAITKVFGDGLRFVAIAVHYDSSVQADALDAEDFIVEGRTVTDVYPANAPEPGTRADEGSYVIVVLSSNDEAARLKQEQDRSAQPKMAGGKPSWKAGDPNVSDVTWHSPAAVLATPDGDVATSSVRNLVVDQFEQRVWQDPDTGDTLPYNLFIPNGYDRAKSYPLVNFMHDAGATSEDPLMTLKQGLGAISWASPQDQAARPAFVLAPQYAEIIADDENNTSSMLDTTINLIKSLTREFSIDPARLYTTGQSGGGMMSIAMNVKYPDFFAASFLVACQWGPELVEPMAGNRMFIITSQDDGRAFPGQNALTEALEAAGATVARAVWDGTWTDDQYQFAFDDLNAEGARINYVSFAKGTVIPEGESTEGAAGHQNTWRLAYSIEPVRAWLLRTDP